MFFVKPEFLKENPESTILDCRFVMTEPDHGPAEYKKEHLEGAIYVNLDSEMVGKHGTHGGRHPLPDMNVFRKIMESKGVSDNKKTFIYDDGTLPMAARLWYMLKLIGKDSYIIQGGFEALKNAGFKTTTEIPVPEQGRLKCSDNRELLVGIKDVLKAMNDPDTVIVDCRSQERYLGKEEPFDKIAGHIPTAKNIFWKDLLNETSLKPEKDLKEIFKPLENYKKIIFHCGSGITGAVEMFIYNELGKKSSLYAGSYSDYLSYEGNKLIVEGEKTITL